MPKRLNKTPSLLYIHIPKTAGQSIHQALGQKNGPHIPLRRRKINPSHIIFTTVRNPYDRALSLFHWFRQLHLDPQKKRNPHNAAMNLLATGCEDANEFWTRFCRNTDLLHYQRRYTPMLATQLSFLVRKKGTGRIAQRINHILRFEHLDKDWTTLATTHNLPPLPHINKSLHAPWQEALTDECKKTIATIYQRDFQTLGYEA
jgi:hypothetical protein